MRVLRYLASYVPKTDKALKLTNELFRNVPNDPEPPIPQEISQLIPEINEKSKIWANSETVVQSFNLKYESRAKLMNRIVSFFGTSLPSLSQNEYLAMITLQSCCTLFFSPVELIAPNDLMSFMKCLKVSIKFLPKDTNIMPDFFVLIYERLLNINDITLFLPAIQEFTKEYPEYILGSMNTNYIVIKHISASILNETSSLKAETIDIFAAQFSITADAFFKAQHVDKEICKKILPEVFLIMGYLKNQRTISNILYPIIKFFIALKKNINCDIVQLVELLKFLIQSIHNLFDSGSKTTSNMVLDTISNINYIKENEEIVYPEQKPINFKYLDTITFDKQVPNSLTSISKYENLIDLMQKYDNPLFKISILLGKQLNNFSFDFTNQLIISIFKHYHLSFEIFVFLILFVQQFDKYHNAICQVFTTLNLWQEIFGKKIFNPNIPLDSNVIHLRQSIFEALSKLAENDENATQIIYKKYIIFLKSIMHDPKLFSQVMEMSFQYFDPIYTNNLNLANKNLISQNELFEIIMQHLLLQQEMHLKLISDVSNLNNSNISLDQISTFRIKTMSVLYILFQSDNVSPSIIQSKYFCSGALYFLFEDSVQEFYFNIISRLSAFITHYDSSKINDSLGIIDSIHNAFLFLRNTSENLNSIVISNILIKLFIKFISVDASYVPSILIASSSVLMDIMLILSTLQCNSKKTQIDKILHEIIENGLTIILLLQNSQSFKIESVPFSAIGESINRIGLTENILDIIYKIIFGGSINSSIIVHPDALKMLILASKNTYYFGKVLKRLIDLCSESVCNCCSCLIGNVPTNAFENSHEKDIPLSITLFTQISKYVSNRKSLFSFFRLFSSFNDTVLNPLTMPCINALEQIIMKSETPEYCSLMQFSSSKSIIYLPPLTVKDLSYGFVVSVKILLDSENCNRFLFEFKNEKQFFSVSFVNNSLCFQINDEIINSIIRLPIRKLFNLSLYFKSFQICDIYIDNNQVNTINLPETQFYDFKNCAMFHQKNKSSIAYPLQTQFATIYTKTYYWNLNLNLSIPMGLSNDKSSQQNELQTFINNSTKFFDFDASKVVPFESGKNIFFKIPSSQYMGLTIRFFTNFLKVFEASHSVSFLITLFAQIDFYDQSNSPYKLLDKLLVLLTLLIAKSPENSNNMLACNSYSIISFFLSSSSYSHLNIGTWKSFFNQMTVMESEKQKEMICQYILFNYKIWERASLDTKLQIFKDWKMIDQTFPKLSSQYLHLPFLLYIFRTFIPSNDNLPRILNIENIATKTKNDLSTIDFKLVEARESLCSLMLDIFEKVGNISDPNPFINAVGVRDTDFNILFHTIIGCSEDLPAIELLDFVAALLKKYNLSLKFSYISDHINLSIPWNYLVSSVSIKSTWACLFFNMSQKVCCKLLSILVQTNYINQDDVNKYIQYLISRRECDNKCNIDLSTDCLVTNFCRLMFNIKEVTSIEKMLLMDSLEIYSPLYFTYAICSSISTSVYINSLFETLFDKICNFDTNVILLAEQMTPYALFYLLYWAVKRSHSGISSISKIISRNSLLLQNAINILDSFSITSGFDLSDIRSKLIEMIIQQISGFQINTNYDQIGEILALGILFRPKIIPNGKLMKAFKQSPFYNESDNIEQSQGNLTVFPEIEQLSSFYTIEPNPEHPMMPVFSLYYDFDGKWVEIGLAKLLISFLYQLWKEHRVDIHQSLCILITLYIRESINCIDSFKIFEDGVNSLSGIIEELVSYYEISDEFINLIFGTINKYKSQLAYPTLNTLLKKYYNRVNENTFYAGYFALKNYCDQPPASLPSLYNDIFTSFLSIHEQIPKMPKPLSAEIMHSLNEMFSRTETVFSEKRQSSKRHWRYLWQQMSYERSPFYIMKSESLIKKHFKRSPYVDIFFRPMLKRNPMFNRHKEASLKRDSYKPETASRISRTISIPLSSLPSHFNISHDISIENFSENNQQMKSPSRYIWKARCELVKITKITEGTFVITSSGFSFLDIDDVVRIFIPPDSVYLIFYQYMLQRPTATEIFTTNHKSYFFNFPDVDSHKFVSYFKSIPLPNARFIQSYSSNIELNRLGITEKWVNREISTFEYLMWLNELSGRSMNNLNAYPIFPWILTDYKSESIDLNNINIYRDLSKPMGALNKQRLAKLKLLKEAVPDINYLYQSTYSSVFMVLHLLVRLEPFTTVHIKYQDGKFDVPTRVFLSIDDCFERCNDSASNFRELIPEFFFCPEFLRNNDRFDLGVLPDGTRVNNVLLPPWAKSPEEFIHIHKQALESDYVSDHINNWIDLIWGYKQDGVEAEKADNTFDPRLYPNCWEKITDQNDIPVVEDMLMKVGTIPQKLFDSPHPTRSSLNDANHNLPQSLSKINFIEIKVANSSIIDTKINGDSFDKFSVFSLHQDGRVFISRTNNTVSAVIKDRVGNIAVHAASIDVYYDSSIFFAFATENSSELVIIKSNGSMISKVSSLHIDAISSACFYRDEIITGGKDSILVKWNIKDKNQGLTNTKSLMAHADTVSCIFASNVFGIVASCSIDGLLVLSHASDFSFLTAIEMNLEKTFIPTQILITEMTGRIIVLCENSNKGYKEQLLLVYSLNGDLISKIIHDKKVTAWCQAPRTDGLDFIVVADDANNIVLFDAFDLKTIKTVYQTKSKVSHLSYKRNIDMLNIGTESGTLYVGSLFH